MTCFHSLCEPCIENILGTCTGRKQLQCPECRTTYKADKEGAKTFPQNKYIISYLSLKKRKTDEVPTPGGSSKMDGNKNKEKKYTRCTEHNLEMTLICIDCNEKMCSRCYLALHKLHDVMDSDMENEKYKQYEAKIHDLIRLGREDIEQSKARTEIHYTMELQRLEKFKRDATAMINSFVNNKKKVIANDKENSLREINKANDTLNEVDPFYNANLQNMKLNRLNARQAERAHQSVLRKLRQVKTNGISVRSYHYEMTRRSLQSEFNGAINSPTQTPTDSISLFKQIPSLNEGR